MNGSVSSLPGDTVPLLKVVDLAVGFGEHRPVRGIGFEIREGETVAIVGESGSGKSLTALSIMGLLPDGGRVVGGGVHFQGREITSLPAGQLRQLRGRSIGMIFQEPMTSLNPVLTIGEQIGEVLRAHEGLSRARARERSVELLERVRIPDPARRLHDYPHELSGGMRQRVMIAMAVACRPRLLIADEPTTALDVTIQAQILDLIDRLRKELSMAVLLITHDLGVVAQWADRVVVMYAGSKVEQGDAASLFARPLHPYTRGLLAASPRLHGDCHYSEGPLYEIPGLIALSASERGCAFAPRCPVMRPSCREAVPALVHPEPGRETACSVTLANVTLADAALAEDQRALAVDL